MVRIRFREESPYLVRLLEVLEELGAMRPAGVQIRQEELYPLVGCRDKRHLATFLKMAKEYSLFTTTTNREGSGWGTTVRRADSYHLKVTAAQWAEMLPGILEQRELTSRSRVSAARRSHEMETKRLVRIAKRMTPVQRAVAMAVPVDLEAARARAATYSDDDDFTGW